MADRRQSTTAQRIGRYLLAGLLLWPASAFTEDLRESARNALEAASETMQGSAVAGGYAGIVDTRSGARFGESRTHVLSPSTIWLQPPGTPAVGQCYVRAFRVTGQRRYLDAALRTGAALATAQLRNGGWDYVADMDGWPGGKEPAPLRRDGRATLDDETTQGVLAFLIDLDGELDLPWLDRAIADGLNFLLRAQHASGGWPQAFPPSGTYKDHDTFNDGAINNAIAVLLRAHDLYRDRRYLDAALRGGEFIVKSQHPPPQAGWAQQYDAQGRPAPGRSFEPAALSAETTAANIRTLFDLYLRTGDSRYSQSIQQAARWLEGLRIGPELWPRFTEIGSGRPLYVDRAGRRYAGPAELPENVRSYRWQGSFGVPRALSEAADLARLGLEGYRAHQEAKRSREGAARARSAERRLASLVPQSGQRGWIEAGELRSGTFVRNCALVLDFLSPG